LQIIIFIDNNKPYIACFHTLGHTQSTLNPSQNRRHNMRTYRLALIGFGNVAQGFVQILQQRAQQLRTQHQADIKIVAVTSPSKGSLYHPQGIDPAVLLNAIEITGNFSTITADYTDWDTQRIIRESNANVILELSPTNLKTAQPALSYIETALQTGKHVITANKGPTALYYPQLKQLAQDNQVTLGIEGTVMSGTPSLMLAQTLRSAGITRIQGILNGTTNYMLTRMEAGLSYNEALTEAQERGYAETDPTGDVEGHDAVAKVVILANLLMDASINPNDVQREGITQITTHDIQTAQQAGKRYKLIGTLERQAKGRIRASVQPEQMDITHPLASVSDATNAITYSTQLMGDITLVGSGAGRIETGYALLTDLLKMPDYSKSDI
jgi:homoserine dehydrogenase